jgi:transposase InsO family protein
VSQLDTSGLIATFESGVCSITDSQGKSVLQGGLENGLYTLAIEGSAYVSELRSFNRLARHSNSIDIWHQRFGHLNYVDVKRVLETTLKTPWKLPDPVSLCQTCIQTKQQQRVAHTQSSRTSVPFELIHSDLCGPIKGSIGGNQYYIVYIDDCTRYTEVYFLVTKSAEEISAKFQNYQAWVEARGFHIKRFRCDNGSGEYNNSMFLGLLGEKGIAYEPAPPYTQHKNGVAERMIRTLNTKARSMMWEANVPTKFWPEAIRTACYLHRRSPTTSLSGNCSPFEALFGTVPPIEHLRRFGCRACKHIPPAQRNEKKFGSRSNPSMMLGYVHNTTKIWRIWDFNSGKAGRAVECSSVVFDENEDAFASSTGEREETVEFPDQTEDQSQQVDEMTVERTDNSMGMKDTGSKSISQNLVVFTFTPKNLMSCRAKEKSPVVTAYFAGGELSTRLMNGRGSHCHSRFAGGR